MTKHDTTKVTVRMNKMGHLHIWRGDKQIHQISKYNFEADGKQSDLYLQDEQDVKFFLELTGEDNSEMIREGCTVKCEIFEEWFGE